MTSRPAEASDRATRPVAIVLPIPVSMPDTKNTLPFTDRTSILDKLAKVHTVRSLQKHEIAGRDVDAKLLLECF